jgi:hypothetical protein
MNSATGGFTAYLFPEAAFMLDITSNSHSYERLDK